MWKIREKMMLTENEMKVIEKQVKWRDRMRIKDRKFNKLNLPQGLILKRLGILSIQNLHRLAMLTRMNKLLRTQRPIEEFNIIYKYLNSRFDQEDGIAHRNIRSGVNFPHFRYGIEHENYVIKKLENCVPKTWFDQYHMISRELRHIILNKEFPKIMKNEMYMRCQHKENDNETCNNCGETTSSSRPSRARSFLQDLNESEGKIESSSLELELESDGTYTEISWDELGSEIFTINSSLPTDLVQLIASLSQLE